MNNKPSRTLDLQGPEGKQESCRHCCHKTKYQKKIGGALMYLLEEDKHEARERDQIRSHACRE